MPAEDPIIDAKQTEKDLKAAGEFLRGDELENFRTKRSAKRSTTPASKKARAKSPVDEHSSDYDSAAEGTKPKELSPQDQLALALTAKLQADLENSKPRAPVLAHKMYRLSEFMDNRQLMVQAGICKEELLDQYVLNLDDAGFETPLLMMGLRGNLDFLRDVLQFKAGHAVRVVDFLARIAEFA